MGIMNKLFNKTLQFQISFLKARFLQLYEQKQYRQAIPIATQLSELVKKASGENHPDYADSLNDLGVLYHLMDDKATAVLHYEMARSIRRQVLGENHPNYAQSLNNLGQLYQETGDYTEAEPLLHQASEIQRQVVGENHPDYAKSLYQLGMLYVATGNYAAAEPLLYQATEIRRKTLGENHADYTTSLNDLAMLYLTTGNYAAAMPLSRQVCEIVRQARGEDHADYAASLSNLAMLYHEMGHDATAEPLMRQAIEIQRKALGENNGDYAQSLNNLAVLYLAMGNYATAEPLLRQATETRRKTLGENHADYAQSLNNLALLYLTTGNYVAAEQLLRQTSEIFRQAWGEDHPALANPLNNLAELYRGMGNYAAAEPLFRQASEIWHKSLGENNPVYARSLNNLALLYVPTNRVAEALSLMQETITIDDQMIGQVFSIGSESQRLAYLMKLQANLHVFLTLVVDYFPGSPEARQSALDLVLRRKAIGAEALATQRDAVLSGHHPALRSKLQELTTWRQQIAQKTLSGPGPVGLEAHQTLLAEWNAQRERLEEELVRQIPEMNLEKRLRNVNRQAIANVLPNGAVLIEFVRFDRVDFMAVLSRGDPQWKPARYLAFVLPAGEPDYLQMIDLGEAEPIEQMIAGFRASITGEEEEATQPSTDRESKETTEVSVRSDRSTLLQAIVTSTRQVRPVGAPLGPLDNALGISLRQALFDPIKPYLNGHTRLFLAPDGEITQLPFEVLPIDGIRQLIDAYQISYLSVGRDLLRFEQPAFAQSTAPLVAADPDFDLGSNSVPEFNPGVPFRRLEGTQREGEAVASLLEVNPVMGDQVLETTIKARQSPRILHFATHGFFLPNPARDPNKEQAGMVSLVSENRLGRLSVAANPLLRSGLALAGSNIWIQNGELPEEAEDGLLTAEDVTGLDLLGTELVVLSACETGLGDVLAGEGVFGLRRSFVLAGAQTLVMSLWKVPDQQTQELMEDFYLRVLVGQPRAEALREAQRAMKEKAPELLYWGAFICQGNPGPLTGATL